LSLIMNLCSNAVQAMSDAGGVLSVSMEDVTVNKPSSLHGLELHPGSYVLLTISDTGRGINPDVMDRMFEPYFTTRGTGSGSGLGLSVVQGIVKKNRGAIRCRSEPGKGTSFSIYLPRVESREEPTKETVVEKALSAGTERILFIDDERDLADLGKMALENYGYKVTSTTSSSKALELFQANPDSFDLVITDMTMPDITGDRLAQKLMEIRNDIPVILCSGYGEHIIIEELKHMGIREYVMKPFSFADLTKTIRNVLDKSLK